MYLAGGDGGSGEGGGDGGRGGDVRVNVNYNTYNRESPSHFPCYYLNYRLCRAAFFTV